MSLVGVVYKLHSDKCSDFYIGSSVSFAKRRQKHRSAARAYNCNKLYCKMREIGVENWIFTVLEKDIDYGLLTFREQYYIDTLKPTLNSNKAHILETKEFKYDYNAKKLR